MSLTWHLNSPDSLGPVDGFNQDKTAGETDDSFVALDGFLASHRDTFEALQLADALLDPSTGLVKQPWKEARSGFRVGAMRDDRNNAAFAAGGAVVR